MIGLIDYGVGNVRAFVNSYKSVNIAIKLVQKNADFEGITKIILPGVGAFDDAMQRLQQSGMREQLDELVLEKKMPVIGICVGMQMLTRSSEEGTLPGLCWVDAVVKRFDPTTISYTTHLPHMGWNDVKPTQQNAILKGLEQDAKFYFLHSYYVYCNQAQDCIASTQYGIEFASLINHENIYGVQCHPEKSHHYGTQLLKNFAELAC